MFTSNDHVFVVCAYKENKYLEETILSLEAQSIKSRIVVSTSTPNDHIGAICERHGLDLLINENPTGAGSDWNYGFNHVDEKLVTIAHQDDRYSPVYLESMLAAINGYDDCLFAYSGYYEIRNDADVYRNVLLSIKRLMNKGFSYQTLNGRTWFKRLVLSFGDPICCPSVTLVRENVGSSPFDEKYVNSCDYKTWVDFAMRKGRFVYCPKPLVGHRIYSESATTKNLGLNLRKKEDLEILSILWPRPIARLINHIYSYSERSNEL